ncbi:MAG: translocation/assembly module TamB domain-containing protein [Pseudomonadota bacterium]
MIRRLIYAAGLATLAGIAVGQEAGFVERNVENALSGPGRIVDFVGFQGALSSSATADQITIADNDGVWITLSNVALNWDRAALLRGRVEVTELVAAEVDFQRAPGKGSGAPEAAASGFSLPELPVSVRIGRLAADRLILGSGLLGSEMVLGVSANAQLADGTGDISASAARLDGPTGAFDFSAAFDNETQMLSLDVDLEEGPGGLVVQAFGLPGEPSVDLALAGAGPLDRFDATLSLATDAEDRLTGQVRTSPERTDDGRNWTAFSASLSGNITPLFLPEYQEFFGPDTSLELIGRSDGDGHVDVNAFSLRAATLDLSGEGEIVAGRPSQFMARGRLAAEDGRPVLLPLSGPKTRIERADLVLDFDAQRGEAWSGEIAATGLDRPDATAEVLRLSATGTIATDDGPMAVTANLDFDAEGLGFPSEETSVAVGEAVTGRASIRWQEGAPLVLDQLELVGESYALGAIGQLERTGRDLGVSGSATVSASDLGAFAGLVGRPIGGAAEATLSGRGQILGGAFDLALAAETQSLSVGVAKVDALTRTVGNLRLMARRDEAGLVVEDFALETSEVSARGSGKILESGSRIDLDANLTKLGAEGLGIPGPADLVLSGEESEASQWQMNVDLTAPDTSLEFGGTADFARDPLIVEGVLSISAGDIGGYSGLAQRSLSGTVDLSATGHVSTDLRDLALEGRLSSTGLVTDIAEIDPILAGQSNIDLALRRSGDVVDIDRLIFASDDVDAEFSGQMDLGSVSQRGQGIIRASVRDATVFSRLAGRELAGGGRINLSGHSTFNLEEFLLDGDVSATDVLVGIPDIDPLLRGTTNIRIRAERDREEISIESLKYTGPLGRLAASGIGDLAGNVPRAEGAIDAELTDLSAFSQVSGLDLKGSLQIEGQGAATFDLDAVQIDVEAEATGLGLGQPELDDLLAGRLGLVANGSKTGARIAVNDLSVSGSAIQLSASGSVGDHDGDLAFDGRLDTLARFVPGLAGPLTASGRARPEGGNWTIETRADGPGGLTARISGDVRGDGQSVDLGVVGQAPLQIANRFIAPRSLTGAANFDLRISGAPSLQSLSGPVTVEGARFADPQIPLALEDIALRAVLSNANTALNAQARFGAGGSVVATGSLGLLPPNESDINVVLRQAVLRDPTLYETAITGNLDIRGPLSGNARISGALDLGPTEFRVPSTSISSLGAIPEITHIGETPEMRTTRDRAGLVDDGAASSGRETDIALDVQVSAPNRIFIRGRGLEAELGGALRLLGSANDLAPIGQFDLIRGRLDILGQRLALTEGRATLQGSLDPNLRLVATTTAETDGGSVEISIVVEGLASDPTVSFVSSPELPEDEVLALLLFGVNVENLSAFQAAQLAAAVATLAGRGGGGLVNSVRESLGLDDLDVVTGADGGTELTFGRYLADNLYTDVTVGTTGESTINLNLDVTRSITIKGSAGSDGSTGLGIFIERDY